ncbi:MAG: class I SAM-dependent methyltransferase, partial [Rhodothermales bacterium]|nr:class I SAM-dependent methyltransferase [Rhodothermales bacterium]
MDRSLRDSLALVEDSHWWFVGRRRILRALLERHEVEGPLLEVGCGTGANLPMLAEFGSVVGVEPDSLDLSRAQERGIGRLVQGALPHQLHVDDQFGTVLALDVIEHVDD